MAASGTVLQLWDNQAPEAPGIAFDAWHYCQELSRAGLAKKIGGAYATLITIAFHADKQAHAWPSVPTLAKEVGCTERIVMRDIKALERVGALVIKKRPIERGGFGNLYIIVPVIALLRQPQPSVKKQHQPRTRADIVTPDNIVTPDEVVTSTPDNIVPPPVSMLSAKGTHKEATTKKQPTLGADKPRRRPVNLKAVSTEDDKAASMVRRLALKLARDVFGAKSSAPDVLGRYEAYFDAATSEGATVDDLRAFLAWMASNAYWSGKARMFTDGQMTREWSDWVGQGKPPSKVNNSPTNMQQLQRRGPASTLTATATEMREAMHGIAFCPECDRVLPNHKQSCSKAAGAQGGAA